MKSLENKNSIYFQKDFYEDYRIKSNLNIAVNSILFLLFFIIFFLFQHLFLPDNLIFDIVINSFVLLIFVVSAFKIKTGFYIYIFLLPLINFLFVFFDFKPIPVVLFMTFPLILGLFANKASFKYVKNELPKIRLLSFSKSLSVPVCIFIMLILMSLFITVLRYANFWPFFTSNYHNLKVNIYGGGSTNAIFTVLWNFFNYTIGFGILLVVINAFDEFDDILKALLILMVSTAVSSVFGIFQKFLFPWIGNYEPWISSGRINSTFTDPNALGSYAVLVFPVLFILIFYFKKWCLKIIAIITLIIFLITAFFSGSRSSLIGISLALIIFLFIGISKLVTYLKKTDRRKRIVIRLIIYLVLFIIISSSLFISFTQNKVKQYIQNSGVTSRVIESVNTAISYTKKAGIIEGIKSASNKRNFFWVRAYQMGRDYPMSGVGIGAFIIELPDYHWKYDKGFDQIDYAGSYYLQLFAEIGIPGLFLMLVIFLLIILKFNSYRKLNRKRLSDDKDYLICLGLFISFISMVIILFFGSHLNNLEVQITLWLIISLLISYISLKTGENISSDYEDRSDIIKINKKDISFNLIKALSFITILFIFTFNGILSAFGNTSIYIKQDYFNWPAVWGANTAGFYLPEGYGKDSPRFTEKDMTICLEKKASKLSFALKAQNPDIDKNPLYVKIYFDYKLVTTVKLKDKNWHKYTIKIPQNGLKSLTLTIINSRTFVPKEWGVNEDTRELGVMFGELGFTD